MVAVRFVENKRVNYGCISQRYYLNTLVKYIRGLAWNKFVERERKKNQISAFIWFLKILFETEIVIVEHWLKIVNFGKSGKKYWIIIGKLANPSKIT